ncbi:MAG TPA: acyltransferase domain-containing protein, partial [Streptosporangiaceae bacterium]|nr:acyltransferase domain-containing protein [Streptosporangiaceae bacterium]
IVEQAPDQPAEAPAATAPALPAVPCVLSAASAAGLRGQAARLGQHLDAQPGLALADVGMSLATTRARLPHRAAILAGDLASLRHGLRELAGGPPSGAGPRPVRRVARDGRVAFLFAGQGSQRAGMGQELHAAFPVFAATLDAVSRAMDGHLDHPLTAVMFAPAGSATAGLLNQTEFTQPALFAFEVALYRLLESWGIVPDAVLGHSVGALAAAHAAGVLTLDDACALVAARGEIMSQLPPGGAMAAVRASEDEIIPVLAGHEQRVCIAAVNGPGSVVLSGARDALEPVVERLTAAGRRAVWLRVSHAFHSPLVDPALAEFRSVAQRVTYRPAQLTVVSDLTGRPAAGTELADPEYWVRHMREAVRFERGMHSLADLDCAWFAELGPAGDLTPMAAACLRGDERREAVPTVRRDTPEPAALLGAVARLHACGVDVDWAAVFAGRGAERTGLPTYAFQRDRYWLADGPAAEGPRDPADLRSSGLTATGHPMLSAAAELPGLDSVLLTGRLSLAAAPWLADHRVGGDALVPGTALLDLALQAGRRAGCDRVRELVLEQPLPVPERGEVLLSVLVSAGGATGDRDVTVHSRPDDGTGAPAWVRHASGVLAAGGPGQPAGPEAEPEAWPPAAAEPLEQQALYEDLAARGLHYGPAFRGVRAAWRRGDEVFAEIAVPGAADTGAYALHPALLDAALHPIGLGGLLRRGDGGDGALMPFTWSDVTVWGTAGGCARVRLTPAGPGAVRIDVADGRGRLVARVGALALRPVPPNVADRDREPDDGLLEVAWTALPAWPQPGPGPARWALLGDAAELTAPLAGSGVILDSYPDQAALERALAAGDPVPDVLILPGPADPRDPAGAGAGPDAAGAHGTARLVLSAAQLVLTEEKLAASRLAVLTRGAVCVAGEQRTAGLSQHAAWGLLRSAQTEHPGRFALVDEDGSDPSRRALPAALSSGEPQVALRGGAGFVPRLGPAGAGRALDPPSGGSPWRLDYAGKGALDKITLAPWPEAARPLAPGQIRVRLAAAGLNFRDVLLALEMIPAGTDPDAAGSRQPGEGAGTVLEVGPGVTAVSPGDRVMGLFSGVGPVTVTDSRLVCPIPGGWTFAQAAAV